MTGELRQVDLDTRLGRLKCADKVMEVLFALPVTTGDIRRAIRSGWGVEFELLPGSGGILVVNKILPGETCSQ